MKISIITTVWNKADTVMTAMQSVANQRVEDYELEYIVVDGASTDGTVELIRRFADRQVDVEGRGQERNFSFHWISEKDRSLYDGINKGIRMATGDVIGICNADDILAEDDVLSKIAAAFNESDKHHCPTSNLQPSTSSIDAVYADVRFVKGGESVDELRRASTVRYCTGRFFRNWMFRLATFPAHPSTFIRRECFEKYGCYSLDYSICADFELMLRFFYTKRIRARYLPICTHVMRTGGVSTKNVQSNVKINKEDLRALKANGVWSCLPLIYLKYFAKIWGFVFRR